MKKQLIVLFTLVAISLVIFSSCEPFIENKITVRNLASGAVKLNIRAKLYDIAAGQTLVLNDFKKGTFEYETMYSVPSSATTFSAEGDVSGSMILNAGTEILLVYTSTIDSSNYVIYGSMTSTDDVNRVDPFADGTGTGTTTP
jgi:hypothetical protein